MSALTVRNLSKQYGSVHALRDISFAIDSGEFVVLLGPSGCGKSTLLNIVAGLARHTAGDIEINGRNVNRLPARDRDIAMVFQSYALYPSMTVRQNIMFGMKCRGVPRREQAEAVARIATLLQIEPLLERKPSALSGGQRQRVAIGRALVRDPALFLFDEPLSNLDATLRVQMRMEIKQLHQRIRKTTLYVTHDQVEAMTLASRVAVMHAGRVQQFDRPEVIYNNPANLFVARFMGSPPMNTVPARLVSEGDVVHAVIGADTARPARLTLGRGSGGLQAWTGRDVVLGIRPENISALEDRSEGAGQAIEAEVVMTEPTGAETIVVLNLGGETFLSRVGADAPLRPGSRARFVFDTRKACLFDPGTEELLHRQPLTAAA